MGLELYDLILGQVKVEPVRVPEVVEREPSVKLPNDTKLITMAQFDGRTQDTITAHELADYRRKTFNLRLLPKCSTMFDYLLEGSPKIYELLTKQSPYT